MNKGYNIFARFYDFLTENVDYDAGSEFISGIFKDNGVTSILDLACGTGKMSERLLEEGFSIIGIDNSVDMLTEAQCRLSRFSDSFSLIRADMRDFLLEDKVDSCICCLDSINHLIDEKDVFNTFKNVFNSLNKMGIFIFDVNTVYKHRNILKNRAFVFDEEDFFLSWDNELLEDGLTVRIMLDFFVFNGESYNRYSEEFYEKAYESEALVKLLEDAGFNTIDIYSGFDYAKPGKDSERLFFVCRK